MIPVFTPQNPFDSNLFVFYHSTILSISLFLILAEYFYVPTISLNSYIFIAREHKIATSCAVDLFGNFTSPCGFA